MRISNTVPIDFFHFLEIPAFGNHHTFGIDGKVAYRYVRPILQLHILIEDLSEFSQPLDVHWTGKCSFDTVTKNAEGIAFLNLHLQRSPLRWEGTFSKLFIAFAAERCDLFIDIYRLPIRISDTS